MGHDRERAERAAMRAGWPGKRTTLQQGGEEDVSGHTTVEERLGMMWELSRGAWSLTGVAEPTYLRSQIPGRIVRPNKK